MMEFGISSLYVRVGAQAMDLSAVYRDRVVRLARVSRRQNQNQIEFEASQLATSRVKAKQSKGKERKGTVVKVH